MKLARVVGNACLAVVLVISLSAAEKNRDWQMGQVAPSKSSDARIQYIAAADKTYVVRGDDLGLAVGDAVRFAVQDKTMYVSLEGREYKLAIIGATVKLNPAPAAAAPAAPPTPAPASPPAPAPTPPPAAKTPEAPKPVGQLSVVPPLIALDNDGVVKMIVGGLKEDTVIQVIQSRPGSFSLTPASLDALRAAGVTPSVIAAMTAKMNSQRK